MDWRPLRRGGCSKSDWCARATSLESWRERRWESAAQRTSSSFTSSAGKRERNSPSQDEALLIHPVVGTRGGFFAVLAHVDFEAPTIAALLPIGNAVAQAVEERAAAQIIVAHQQTTEMTQMADIVGAQP